MKTVVTFAALALISNMAVAETFEYEHQIASQDLDPNIPSLSEDRSNPAVSRQQPRVSLFDVYRGNPDTEVNEVKSDNIADRHSHIYTAYDALVDSNPDLEV